jgi:hypothetical protein
MTAALAASVIMVQKHHGVPVKALRSALGYADKALGIDRLLLRPELRADAGRVFLDRYGELIELPCAGCSTSI